MIANNPRVTAVGNDGIFELLAERLSALPSGRDARPDGIPAPDGGSAGTPPTAETSARDTALVLRPLGTRYAPGLHGAEGRAIALCGLWARVAFVGASLFIAGVVVLADGVANVLPALGLILGGSAVATLGWRWAWKALDSIEAPSSGTAGTTGATTRNDVGQTLQQC